MTDFMDVAVKTNPFLQFFTGYHGKAMDLKMDVPVVGEVALHQLMAEQTTGALAFAQGLAKTPTAKVEIIQKEYFLSVDVSEAETRFSVIDIVAMIKERLARSSARTIIASAINGDTVTTANSKHCGLDNQPS